MNHDTNLIWEAYTAAPTTTEMPTS